LQGTELAKGVDIDIVEIAVCRAREIILAHVAIAALPVGQYR
jgi:hypothetical protein